MAMNKRKLAALGLSSVFISGVVSSSFAGGDASFF